MKEACKNNLAALSRLLLQMSDSDYSKPCRSLFGASIGQHTRHVIELYMELLQGIKNNEICYDNRIRNALLETDVTAAVEVIGFIIASIEPLQDEPIKLKANYSVAGFSIQLNTSVFRELAYNLEHCIHHYALIKTGLQELGKSGLVDGNFGVAASTIQFKQKQLKIQTN